MIVPQFLVALPMLNTVSQSLHRALVLDPGYFVALQFLAWIVVGPLIVFQILLCVRENQLHPVRHADACPVCSTYHSCTWRVFSAQYFGHSLD